MKKKEDSLHDLNIMEDSTERRSLNHMDFHHSESVPKYVGLQAPEIFESIIIVTIRIIMMIIHTA